MVERKDSVVEHYGSGGLADRVVSALLKTYGSLDGLRVDDLVSVDSFHMGGRAATRALAERVGVSSGWRVLDAGSGPGGTARYLASRFGCHVTGVDLTPDFVTLAERLSEITGISSRTRFKCGSALSLPFEGEAFHCVWMEHVQINIGEKKGLLSELYRVLKPGGSLAIHEVFKTGEGGLFYPVPWSETLSGSFLVTPDEFRNLLESQGFTVGTWQDVTAEAVKGVMAAAKRNAGPGSHLLMGENAGDKVRNLGRNLAEGRLAVIQAVIGKP